MMMTDTQREMLRTHGLVLARVLLGATFVFSGIGIIGNGTAGIDAVAGMIDSAGWPLAGLLAYVVVLIKIVGGGALIVGYRIGLAAGLLILFTLAATWAFHMNPDPNGIMGRDIGMWKNLSIIGGLLYAMAHGPGDGWSVRGAKSQVTEESKDESSEFGI